MQSILKEEKNLIFVFLFATLAIFSEKIIFSLNKPLSLLFTVLVMAFIILASLRVAHHAELLAEKVGESYFANRMQQVINIALGATLSTVILTIRIYL